MAPPQVPSSWALRALGSEPPLPERPQAQMAAEAEAAVLGQRRAAVETTLRETQEENDEFRRRILGLEQQLKEARGLAEGGEVAEARLRDRLQRLEVRRVATSGLPPGLPPAGRGRASSSSPRPSTQPPLALCP